MSKRYEYLERTFYTRNLNLLDTLNGYGDNGWIVVSLVPVMFLDQPNLINKYEVIFMKEKGGNDE